MELLVEVEPDQRSPLQIINEFKELLELLLKRHDAKNCTLSIVNKYDVDAMELTVLHSQGYEEKKEALS